MRPPTPGKENVNQNIQKPSTNSLPLDYRRKQTAHFANFPSEQLHQHSPSIQEVGVPGHKKSYSYLNSNPDNESPSQGVYEDSPEESEFEFEMSYHHTEQSQ